jgi:putative transposase
MLQPIMAYPTDLSDAEFRHIEEHLPTANQRGRPRIHAPREILNAVFYVLKSGCPWRLLPRDFPPWRSVYHWFIAWRIDGTWERLKAGLRERLKASASRLATFRTWRRSVRLNRCSIPDCYIRYSPTGGAS